MLKGEYESFIHKSRYARWLKEEGRRENWEETVDRYISYFSEKIGDKGVEEELRQAILATEIMPSMRALMCAGKALDRDNVAGFNCSYLAMDHPRCFDEMMYVLMCGTGVGFSCERQYIAKLPTVADEHHPSGGVINVRDSKIGWASAFHELIVLLYAGHIPTWNVDKVRPSGARLKTFGGRASGPEPLVDLFNFTVRLFTGAAGRKLTSIEVHDLCCKIGDIVVVGGVRRSALISLSNLSDDRMRRAKSGRWWEENPQRALANNSVCYTEKPDFDSFMKEWVALYDSKSGERGVFSRVASAKQASKNGRREPNDDWGTNPCSEIILRPNQFCNLSEVVVRADDTEESLTYKVELATILGTLQATLTNFRYLRPVWKRNTEEESLLGVSLTGIMDNEVMVGTWGMDELSSILEDLQQTAINTNKEWAERLGIAQSAAITCVKPSGTVSQLVDSASGIHPRYAPYYIRRVRADQKDPLALFMKDAGFPCEVDVMKPTSGFIFSFPIKSPDGATCTTDVGAMEQLRLWKTYQDHWCEHKPSITVYYKDEEFFEVGQWLYNNFDDVSGVSFLPYSDHTYQQAPYEEIDAGKYEGLVGQMPQDVDWSGLTEYEFEDNTIASHTLACSAGGCELP